MVIPEAWKRACVRAEACSSRRTCAAWPPGPPGRAADSWAGQLARTRSSTRLRPATGRPANK